MKKILLASMIILFSAFSVFGGEFEDTLIKAKKGDAEAQYKLGSMCYYGQGVPQDYKQAAHWFTKAAEQGDVVAQNNLGVLYANGQGVSQDYKKAVRWYTKAADQGYAVAQYNLGLMYREGKGISLDWEKAVHWYTKAAEQGYADAQNNLGGMYEDGWIVAQDYKKAVHWYTKAAEQEGYAVAQNNLGRMYGDGKGVVQDYKRAVHWYTKAAEQGYAGAQCNLGLMYREGWGVAQDYKLAYVWESLAAAQGYKGAIEGRDIAAFKLSPQQLSEAQDLAAQIQYKIDHPTESQKQEPSIANTENKINGSGTGFIITRDGYVLSCHHVIKGAAKIEIFAGDKMYPASLIREDFNNDLALLKIDGSFPAIAFSPQRSGKMGQDVFTVGYPNPGLQGISAKYTKGAISSLTGFQDDLRLYQISIPVQPGNSGGALLDENGNVLGIVMAMLDAKTTFQVSGSLPQNVNYALKSLYAQAMIDTLPDVAGKLLTPSKSKAEAIDNAQKSTVMVICYD